MDRLRRGLLLGAGFGLAMTTVEFWLLVVRLIQMNLPPIIGPPLFAAPWHLFLAALFGGALSPLLRARWGGVGLLVGTSAIWLALYRATAPSSDFLLPLVVGPPLAGLVVSLFGLLLARRRRWLPALLCAGLFTAAVATSEARRIVESPPATDLAGRARPASDAPDVVLVVLDTVRAANVSAYGYPRETTPTLDALAEQGGLFLEATSPSNWSLPSHASLFTGHFPSSHGAHRERQYLSADWPTLAGTAAAAGWETALFTANPWISPSLGTSRGFDVDDGSWRRGGAGRSMNSIFRIADFLGLLEADKGGADVVEAFADWLALRPRDARPYFVFLNFLEAHFPYHQLPVDYLRRFSPLGRRELRRISMNLFADQFGESDLNAEAAQQPARDMYDAGIAYADSLLGRVLVAVHLVGRYEDTVFVVLSDHGEALGEHGIYGHGRSLFEEDTRVPLVVSYPPRVQPRLRVSTPVSTVGVMATVLDLAGVKPEAPLQVRSLMPALDRHAAGAPILAERFAGSRNLREGDPPLTRLDLRLRTYRNANLKLVEASDGALALFDLEADSGETRDLGAAQPKRVARMRRELAVWSNALRLPALDAPIDEVATPELDPAAEERLRALGYVE